MDILRRMLEAKKRDLPYYWCDPTCSRQATHMAKDCECGGAQLEYEAWREKARDG